MKNKKIRFTVVGILVAIALLVVGLLLWKKFSKKDFKDMYGNLSDEAWCTMGNDGSYIRIDTDPKDMGLIEGGGELGDDVDMWVAKSYIQSILKDLGFSDAVFSKMEHTSSKMGQQVEENKKYRVSWTFHPQKGMEVMFEIK